MKIKNVLIMSLVLVFAFSCSMGSSFMHEEQALSDSTVVSAGSLPVKLVKAGNWTMSKYGTTWVNRNYTVMVENLAYDKEIVIWGEDKDGTWKAFPMQYTGSAGGSQEYWELHTNEGPQTFVVRATMNGQTWWDNNGGNNYTLSAQGVTLYNDVKILADTAYASSTYMSVSVNLQNLDYNKSVYVIYTTDGWATTNVKPLTYFSYQTYGYGSAPSPNSAGVEHWRTSFSLDYGTSPVEYCFSYDVSGTTYWDTNNGANYTVNR
jgi:hypothetical protein